MKTLIILAVFSASCAVQSTYARADVESHCAAYAKDFADANMVTQDDWQRRNADAKAACLFQYQPETKAVARSPKKLKATAAVVSAPEIEPETPPPVEKPQPATLVKDSKEWQAYCTNKYTSFNPKTGTYTAKSGKVRPCQVTTY